MAPQHIEDLPRHEEPRQLMLGLIDDLPDPERTGARQLMMWGLGLAVAVVLFVVLVWVTAPTRQNSTSGEPKSDYAQNVGRTN